MVSACFHLDETVGEFGKLAVKTALRTGYFFNFCGSPV